MRSDPRAVLLCLFGLLGAGAGAAIEVSVMTGAGGALCCPSESTTVQGTSTLLITEVEQKWYGTPFGYHHGFDPGACNPVAKDVCTGGVVCELGPEGVQVTTLSSYTGRCPLAAMVFASGWGGDQGDGEFSNCFLPCVRPCVEGGERDGRRWDPGLVEER